MITQKIQNITYYGEDQLPINITNLSNLSFVDKIYYQDLDGNYIGWLSELSAHNFLQGMTTLSSGQSYKIVSKASATFPYTLFFDGDNLKEELEDARVDIDVLQSNVANLGEFTLSSYNEMLGASGVLREDLVAASGDLNSRMLQYVSLLQTNVATASGALREDLVAASGALKTDIVDSGIACLEHTIAISGHLQKDIIESGHKVIDILSTDINDVKEELTDLITDRPRYFFDVTANNSDPDLADAFRFAGVGITTANQDNPTIYLRRGETYIFRVNSPNHPFYIKTEPVINTGSIYNNGVTNNGYTDRVLTFEVPYDAPSLLYYQCANHASMRGLLYTRQPVIADAIDGGNPSSFLDPDSTTTIAPGVEVYDTTATVTQPSPDNVAGTKGISFTASQGDSISYTRIPDDNIPAGSLISPISIFLYTSSTLSDLQFTARLAVATEYRNSGKTFQVTLGGTQYDQTLFSAGDSVTIGVLNGFRINLA